MVSVEVIWCVSLFFSDSFIEPVVSTGSVNRCNNSIFKKLLCNTGKHPLWCLSMSFQLCIVCFWNIHSHIHLYMYISVSLSHVSLTWAACGGDCLKSCILLSIFFWIIYDFLKPHIVCPRKYHEATTFKIKWVRHCHSFGGHGRWLDRKNEWVVYTRICRVPHRGNQEPRTAFVGVLLLLLKREGKWLGKCWGLENGKRDVKSCS